MMQRIIIFLITITAFGCSQKPPPPILEYNGPLKEAADVDMLYAEKDHVKVRMQAKKILEFKNNDQEFPEGVFIEFYDEFGNLTSTLKANHAFYFKEQDLWRGRGKVEVVNIAKKQQLNSEELFWKRVEKKIYTEKFVTIKLENEILYGTGLDAAQDLSYYTIKKPNGVFEVKE